MIIFLTGEKGIGKSTIIKQVLNDYPKKSGGFFTTKKDEGIEFKNLENEVMFYFNLTDDPMLIAEKFDKYGVEQFLEIYDDAELIVMDELGFLERKATKFQSAVMNIVNSNKNVLAVLKSYKNNFFYENLKDFKHATILEINLENRNKITKRILEILNDEKK
ncbi:hypothetical protein J7L48_05765 [bacterium]|nr:hypothetical protein [bacterium]